MTGFGYLGAARRAKAAKQKAAPANPFLRSLTPEQRAQVFLDREAARLYANRLKADVAADTKRGATAAALLPAQAAADTAVEDSAATGKLVRALPWVLGAAAVGAVLYFLSKRKAAAS